MTANWDDARVPMNKSDLCESEHQLLELLHDLYFGRIEDLEIRDGKAVFDPPPRIIAMLKMHAETDIREEAHLRDFFLKQSIVLLLLLIKQIGNGNILVIHVRHGLPFNVE